MKKAESGPEPTETENHLRRDLYESRERESAGRAREAELRDQLAAGVAREEAASERSTKALRAEEERVALGRDFRDRVVAILGHDLRNPLSAIEMAAAFLLRADDLPARHFRTVGRIAQSADRMMRMINDLLDFARGRFGAAMPLHLRPANMRELCRAAIEETEFAHGQRTIAFEGAFEGAGDFDGTWDVDRVMQALSNLLGNALVHGRDPVEVALRIEADSVVLQVRNGGSIPESILPHIFEPFRAAPRNETSSRSGLGLGLYVVKEIVDAHGGTIRVSSTEGDGTIFTVRWPRIVSTPSTARGGTG